MRLSDYLLSEPKYVQAVVGYLIRDDKVLLGLRKKVSLGMGQGVLSGIGGKVGDTPELRGETNEEALVREILEEVAIGIFSYRLLGHVRFLNPSKPEWNQEVFAYTVDTWGGNPVETEVIKPMWFDIAALPVERMWKDNRYWVPRVLEGKKVEAIFLFDENHKIQEYEIK
jgi:8-oxo-dGTP pyrophosphatase MutT (NUDIX family)